MKTAFNLTPDAPYKPQNRLEELLVQLAAEPQLLPDFYTALLTSDLGTAVDSKPPQHPGPVPLGNAGDMAMSILVPPSGLVGVYSSDARMQEARKAAPETFKEHGGTYAILHLPGKELINMLISGPQLPIRGLELNPHSTFSRVLPLTEVAAALAAHRFGGTLRDAMSSEGPRLTALPAKHQRLAVAVHHFCEQRPHVLAAYVGMVQLLLSKPPQPFVWYFTPRLMRTYLDAMEGLIRRLYHTPDAVLVRNITPESSGGLNSPANLAVHFSQDGIEPLFQRVSS